jgi:Flp pilus assembly protein TadG
MKKYQMGATAVEFALVAALFLTVLLGIMDFGRILFAWNSAAEATRLGARVSVVCDKGAARVLADMQKFVPITSSNLKIDWYDGSGNVSTSCDSTNCAGVAVSITGLTIKPVSPLTWIGFSSLTVPGFSTYLPREIMGQDPDSGTVCN